MQIKFTKKTRLKSGISFLILLVTVAVSLGVWGRGEKMYRVGILSGVDPFIDIADGFKAEMGKLGYIEGKDIIYDMQRSHTDPVLEENIVKKFVRNKVDLIFAFPTEAAFAAKSATRGTDIPVIFAMAGIEGNNLIDSVRQPGKNITGVRFPNRESTAKRLEFLHELVPDVKRVYLIYDPNYPNAPFAIDALRQTAESLGITFIEDFVSSVEEYEATLKKRAAVNNNDIDAVFLMPDFINASPGGFAAAIKFANKKNIPIAGGMRFSADGGALFSFVPDNFSQGILAARLADKIFKGTPAGNIPVVTPESKLRLNYKVIREMDLNLPEGLLNKADEIIR